MNIDKLIPFNGKTIQTKTLKEIGYSSKDISKLIEEGNIARTRRGFYLVSLHCDADLELMQYYLINKEFLKFKEYFNSLQIKDYNAYYYLLLFDIMTNNYKSVYDDLEKCCELNGKHENKMNLYAIVLLLDELVVISKDRQDYIKRLIFEEGDMFNLFLESIIKKDYENAFESLVASKNYKELSKLEINILRELSLKAQKIYNKKNSKELESYKVLYNALYNAIMDNDFEQGYFYFKQLCTLSSTLEIKDNRLKIINDLYECFNYIVSHQDIDLTSYQANFEYGDNYEKNFFLAISRNDYIRALDFSNMILNNYKSPEIEIYKALLERIYNFLNIRMIIRGKHPIRKQSNLNYLIKNKKYKKALEVATKDTQMAMYDKNMVIPLLESLVNFDNMEL